MQIEPNETGLPDEASIAVPDYMLPALRSDHAGETGAVAIYRGVLAVARDRNLRAFAQRHLATEAGHLEIMEALVGRAQRSRLLPVWRMAGWLTGALPALFGAAAVYRTIDAVESFVDRHYAEQIDRLRANPEAVELRKILQSCRDDELEHRDEARSRLEAPGLPGRLWAGMVGAGSAAGVYLASRF